MNDRLILVILTLGIWGLLCFRVVPLLIEIRDRLKALNPTKEKSDDRNIKT